jgi:hypothetical protein
MDLHSALADPLCRAPSLDEYGLLPESLALKLGFVPLAPEKTGCVEVPERRTWPIDSDLWRENHRLGVPRATVRTKDLPPQP